MTDTPRVAYFSMEIGINPSMPTYAGGLGVLAGDTIRSAADLEVPMVAVTLLHRCGYFQQRLDPGGRQSEQPVSWRVEEFVEPVAPRITLEVEGRTVHVRAWRYQVRGVSGYEIPVYLLDTDVPENTPWDRSLTDVLYVADAYYRLCQEVVLGIGGVKILRALGHHSLSRFHLNEGHAAMLILALLEERVDQAAATAVTPEDIETVSEQCVFTTHTPVPAGHDKFPTELARRVLGPRWWAWLNVCGQTAGLNMTELALRCSRFVNGVAMRHGEVSRSLFPGHEIRSITNGVHVSTWTSPPFQLLFDRYLPEWRSDALSLRNVIGIPGREIWNAHAEAKRALINHVNQAMSAGLETDVLTLGFARRAATYKRATLIFRDMQRLKAIAAQAGPLQIIFAGKAHPQDPDGKELIRLVHAARDALRGRIAVVYLPNYDMAQAKLLCPGVDVWLNTPRPPLEASGTSGMKAAVNGVPSLSVLDGWWVEGHIEGVTGWAIEDGVDDDSLSAEQIDTRHAAALYQKLEERVVPCYYRDRERFIDIMQHAIALNGSFFNTQRMVWQYVHNAYRINAAAAKTAEEPAAHAATSASPGAATVK